MSELFIWKPGLSDLRYLMMLLITRRDSFNVEDGQWAFPGNLNRHSIPTPSIFAATWKKSPTHKLVRRNSYPGSWERCLTESLSALSYISHKKRPQPQSWPRDKTKSLVNNVADGSQDAHLSLGVQQDHWGAPSQTMGSMHVFFSIFVAYLRWTKLRAPTGLLQNEKLKSLRRTLRFAPSLQEQNSFAENNQKIIWE
jgi:hypothetical protein